MMRWLVLLLIGYSAFTLASDLYPFHSKEQQKQFQTLLTELRCLVCQNEDLASSHAPLAIDLRQKIYVMVKSHDSNEKIKLYLVNRYGNFILFRPPFYAVTYVLWLAPVGMFFLSFIYLFFRDRKRKNGYF